jgi:uncharacterized protein (DUF2336 family)
LTLAQLVQALTECAKLRSSEDREGQLALVIALMEDADVAGADRSEPILTLIEDILMPLVTKADPMTRARLSGQLAPYGWVPVALTVQLSQDEFAIAQPILIHSPLLCDDDLLEMLAATTLDHHLAIAERPNLSPAVVKAILRQQDPVVLTALVRNLKVMLLPPDLWELVEASRRFASLRAPLARHPDLTAPMANALLGWVGEALQTHLRARFHQPLAQTPLTPDQTDMDQRLAERLMASGNLHPSALLRALREDQPGLFLALLARLCDLDLLAAHQIVEAPSPDLMALACRSLELDRSAFAPILAHLRRLFDNRPGGDGDAAAQRAFGPLSPGQAKLTLKWALDAALV